MGGKQLESSEIGMSAVFLFLSLLVFDEPNKAPQSGRVEADIPYAAGGEEHKLDLYLPEKKGFTTIVYIYGGGWHAGTRKSVTPIGQKLQSMGYGCAALSHRLMPPDKFPAQIEDVAEAFAWIHKHIGEKGGDPKRLIMMGHSSGAHLSLLLATDPKYLAKHKLSPADIKAVIGLSPPVNLEQRPGGIGFGDALMGGKGADVFGRDPAVMKDASPIQHVTKDLPPTLLIVGENDFPKLDEDAKAFVVKAKAEKVSATEYVAKGRNHMAVVRGLIEEKSDVLEKVKNFLEKEGK
jgi:acetyl esterase/lipase